ncbi:hypothetical protein [Lactococcus lactis]|uniref:hypothetical protein n=1 Tax=Lactococcus lactis TaxID=1358 RepID=UPI00319DCE73
MNLMRLEINDKKSDLFVDKNNAVSVNEDGTRNKFELTSSEIAAKWFSEPKVIAIDLAGKEYVIDTNSNIITGVFVHDK